MELAQYAILFGILFVLNLVVLVAALFIFGSFMGEVEFGSLFGLIWKGALLALIVSAVQLVPYVGGWLALAIWAGGFVVLFEWTHAIAGCSRWSSGAFLLACASWLSWHSYPCSKAFDE